jgi:L-lactate dehydrogenase
MRCVPMKVAVDRLCEFATTLLQAGGLARADAGQLAETLVAADCLGHHTHGLALLPRYLSDLSAGTISASSEISLVRDGRSVLLFDGGFRPGPVVVHHALERGIARVAHHGAMSIVIRNSGHIACLAAYLTRATERNLVMLILSSNPGVAMVTPHGGTLPVYSPNPLAFGFPTAADPVLIDISMSSVSANTCRQAAARGERLSGAYLKKRGGSATDDPSALFDAPPAALMPLGGADLGYKGYGLALMIEMLTSGLAGEGRSTDGTRISNTTFIYLADPDAFGGVEHMTGEGSWLVRACRAAGATGDVRLPGEQALRKRRDALAQGIDLPAALHREFDTRALGLGVAPLQDMA